MKIYNKINTPGYEQKLIFGIPFYWNKKTETGQKKYRLFGLYKKEYDSLYKKIYIFGIQINKKLNIENLLGYLTNTLKFDTDNFLLKMNRLIMSDISTALIHKQTFERFRGCFRGKKVALICTGPTLNNFSQKNLDKNVIYIGVNAAFKRLDVSYLFCQDYDATKPYLNDLLTYNQDTCIKFLAQLPDIRNEYTNNAAETVFNNKNILKYKLDLVDKYYRRNCSFLPVDITTQPLGDWETVAASARQFILFGQPDVVYLVGCDCTQNHFEEEFDVIKNVNMSNLAANFWPNLKNFKDIYYPETKIISVNPVGLKGMFHDVYTEDYLKEHPEINRKEVEILKEVK